MAKEHVMKTGCEKCGLTWLNKDPRDYSNDRCQSCGQKVKVFGWVDIELSKGPIKIPNRAMDLNVG